MTTGYRRLLSEDQHVIPSQIPVSCTTEGQTEKFKGLLRSINVYSEIYPEMGGVICGHLLPQSKA